MIVRYNITQKPITNQRDSEVVRASALRSVDLGFITLFESYQKTCNYSFPAWRLTFRRCCGEQAGKLSCFSFMGKALNVTPPPLCGREVAQTPRRR